MGLGALDVALVQPHQSKLEHRQHPIRIGRRRPLEPLGGLVRLAARERGGALVVVVLAGGGPAVDQGLHGVGVAHLRPQPGDLGVDLRTHLRGRRRGRLVRLDGLVEPSELRLGRADVQVQPRYRRKPLLQRLRAAEGGLPVAAVARLVERVQLGLDAVEERVPLGPVHPVQQRLVHLGHQGMGNGLERDVDRRVAAEPDGHGAGRGLVALGLDGEVPGSAGEAEQRVLAAVARGFVAGIVRLGVAQRGVAVEADDGARDGIAGLGVGDPAEQDAALGEGAGHEQGRGQDDGERREDLGAHVK